MSLHKQAKILSTAQQKALLTHVSGKRHALRNRVIVLLSTKAGLRAKEIAMVSWPMLTDPEGNLSDSIALQNIASKGKSGRIIPIHPDLKSALVALAEAGTEGQVIRSERRKQTSAAVITNMLAAWYLDLGFEGCSSHSGRRTFITNAARKVSQVGASLKDVQMLAGHSSLATTQRYIEGDTDAQKKLVRLI